MFRLPHLSVLRAPSAVLFVLLLGGCGAGHSPAATGYAAGAAAVAGNLAFSSANSQSGSGPLLINAGVTQEVNGDVTAVAHVSGASCMASSDCIPMTGLVSASNRLTFGSEPVAGATLTVEGQLSPNGNSLLAGTYSFTGANCAPLAQGQITGTQYSSISGTYTGTFTDTVGNQILVTSVLTQTTQPDQNGQFHLSGSSTFPNSICFTRPLLTDSLVTGSSLSETYAASSNGQPVTITATGTFDNTATHLTISNWTV
ncbi:MAG TPA: hypothetical protein VHZ55_24680, partial [Bryobacteraceae bacterium]|nr:hypothetical protein [Bryobacteraceae bacterium]